MRINPLPAKVFVLLFFAVFLHSLSAVAQEKSSETRFVKLDSQGKELPAEARHWAMVRDRTTGLVWEVKTADGSIHDKEKTFSFEEANKSFIPELNSSGFGGFADWRLPTTSELQTLRVKGDEPFISHDYFPNTVATGYLSWRKCGNGDIYDEKVKFGKIRNSRKDRSVRAVRLDLH